MPDSQRTNLYLLGVSVTHSIAPKMHEYIASSFSLPWKFTNLECPTVEDMMSVLKSPTTAGAVITMPYKQAVIPYLSGIDAAAQAIGAVNNVYLTPDCQLRGSNTDWEGVRGCLRSGDPSLQGRGKPALVVGAGGACRAAVFTLYHDFDVRKIYILNRDRREVDALKSDVSRYAEGLELIHIEGESQAMEQKTPFYIVGTVPDFEPKSPSELVMKKILEVFMKRERGVLLDMCFKPRNTRTMKLGREMGWNCICGTDVIAYQVNSQWSLWLKKDVSQTLPQAGSWSILNEQAEKSAAINF